MRRANGQLPHTFAERRGWRLGRVPRAAKLQAKGFCTKVNEGNEDGIPLLFLRSLLFKSPIRKEGKQRQEQTETPARATTPR